MGIRLWNFYQEGTSFRGISPLLQQLMQCWDHARQGLKIGHDMWYHPTEDDVYFIIMLSRRDVYFPHFPMLPPGVVGKTHLEYVQRYVNLYIILPLEFQVCGGQLYIGSFQRHDIRCLSHILSSLS